MSEYTPTTDEMRAFYTAERLDGPHLDGFPPPTVEQAETEFNLWLAAHDAEVQAQVVAEEPEWEYGFQLRESDSGDVYDQEVGFDTEQDATDEGNKRIHDEDDDEYPPLALRLIRRAKSGPWVPVKQEGADRADPR